jgi:hypothetical protein
MFPIVRPWLLRMDVADVIARGWPTRDKTDYAGHSFTERTEATETTGDHDLCFCLCFATFTPTCTSQASVKEFYGEGLGADGFGRRRRNDREACKGVTHGAMSPEHASARGKPFASALASLLHETASRTAQIAVHGLQWIGTPGHCTRCGPADC